MVASIDEINKRCLEDKIYDNYDTFKGYTENKIHKDVY